MHDNKKRHLAAQVRRFRARFAQSAGTALGNVVPQQLLMQWVVEEAGRWRERFYGPLQTLALFIEQVLSADHSCQDAVARGISGRMAQGQTMCSLNSGPYYMGDNQASFPQSREQKPGLGFPLARLVAIMSLSCGAVLEWASGPCEGKTTGETALLWGLAHRLDRGDVVVADRCYAGYFMIALLMALGVDVVIRQHQSRHTDFRRGQRLGGRDHVVSWVRPQRPVWMSKQELLELYCRRWQVELDLRAIKVTMQMDVLRCKSPDNQPPLVILHIGRIAALVFRPINLMRASVLLRPHLGTSIAKDTVTPGVTRKFLNCHLEPVRDFFTRKAFHYVN